MEKTIFEELGGTYRKEGDYWVPNLKAPQPRKPIGKYGRMRARFLKENDKMFYEYLRVKMELTDHLLEIDEAANNRLEELMPKLAAEAGATEQLKRSDPLKWVGLMNSCKSQAEEIICQELIYV